MNKIILILLCFGLFATQSSAQNIKQQAEQQKREQEYKREQHENELKEQARTKKAQLNLSDLLRLVRSSDLEYVDEFLSTKGWMLHGTNVKGTDEYNDETTSDYKSVTWSFDKNTYNDLAKGWFYFYLYTDYDNAVAYTITDKTQLDKLKSELISNGYKRIYPTDAIERGLESVYRNNLYEVTFKKQTKEQYEKGADIRYSFFIYNYVQAEKRIAEARRIAQENARREENYRNAIQQAESAYNQKQYAQAKQFYDKALALKPENGETFLPKIAQIEIKLLCEDAVRFFESKQYNKAKDKYSKALLIRPNTETDYISGKIKEIEDFQQFLTDRSYKKYDYENFEKEDYHSKSDYFETELKKNLLTNAENIPLTTVNIVCEMDTLGNTISNYTISTQNKKLNALLNKLTQDIKLKRCFVNGYTAMAKAEFTYTLEYNHAILSIKHTPNGISSIHKDFNIHRTAINTELNNSKAPYGGYTFNMNKTTINGKTYDSNQLVKMSSTGGPSNAWLSLLVPGLGDHKVTYGKKSGIGTALWTYGLIGAGIGLKFYSNSEYEKYHAATEQSVMDDHYKKANYSNQGFYAGVGLGALIWVSDIIWVASTGSKNAAATKAYKRSHLSVNYHPNLQATGLTYTLKF